MNEPNRPKFLRLFYRNKLDGLDNPIFVTEACLDQISDIVELGKTLRKLHAGKCPKGYRTSFSYSMESFMNDFSSLKIDKVVKEEEPINGLKNLGPDAPLVTNAAGGKQSKTAYRMDLIPPSVLFSLGEVLAYGAEKYGEYNWHKISAQDHLNHSMVHMAAWLAGDKADDHAGHALCRMAMFFEMQRREELVKQGPQYVQV